MKTSFTSGQMKCGNETKNPLKKCEKFAHSLVRYNYSDKLQHCRLAPPPHPSPLLHYSVYKPVHYMGGSRSGQDEANPVFWLATRAGLSCPLGIACLLCFRKSKVHKNAKKKLTLGYIQPSSPHSWSIKHIYSIIV